MLQKNANVLFRNTKKKRLCLSSQRKVCAAVLVEKLGETKRNGFHIHQIPYSGQKKSAKRIRTRGKLNVYIVVFVFVSNIK